MQANDICKVLYTEGEIRTRVKELGEQITIDYRDKDLILVGVLKGSFIFLSDLVRAVNLQCPVDFISVSSYGSGVSSSGTVRVLKGLSVSVENKDVLIVEDILDSGVTLSYIMDLVADNNPASIRSCAFLDKPDRRTVNVNTDYIGFSVPDEFIVGYGLDYSEKYRNLPYIGILSRSVYEK